MNKITSRKGFIDGVVITGGEPTIHTELTGLIDEIKRAGCKVKLDTNGYNPGVLGTLLEEKKIDFIAMDIKTSQLKYSTAAGIDVDYGRIGESIDIIKTSKLEHEFRTTCVPGIVEEEDIKQISKQIGSSSRYTLQQFNPENALDPEYRKMVPHTKTTLMDFMETAGLNVASCRLTGIQHTKK
jgi:pyruvate formate lyase activating enzyme